MVYLPAVNALLAFGLGTVPALFGTGLLTTALGALTLMRGLALLGLVPHFGIW
jgi:sulfite exporter TauE/SafE